MLTQKVKVVEIDQFKNTQEDLAVGRGKGKINNAHREDSGKTGCRFLPGNIPERKETANKRKNVTYWILRQRGCFMSRRLKAQGKTVCFGSFILSCKEVK